MQTYEMNALMKYGYYKSKESWEQARLISFIIAQVNSKKRLKLQDILKFDWEKNENVLTDEEMKEMRERASKFEAMIKGINQ